MITILGLSLSRSTYTIMFLYLAVLYLAEAVITMPSPRNHILWFCFYLAAGTFWEWPVWEMQVAYYQNSNYKSGRAGGRISNFDFL